jgi:hypothetical protein
MTRNQALGYRLLISASVPLIPCIPRSTQNAVIKMANMYKIMITIRAGGPLSPEDEEELPPEPEL